MSDSIERDPRAVYANALKKQGLLAGWTYNYKGIVVLPESTPSSNPQERIPLCVEYMDYDELHKAYDKAFHDATELGKKLDRNFKDEAYSLKRTADNFFVTLMSSAFTVAANQFAPSSIKPFQYAFGGISVVLGGITAFWLRQHFKASSEQEQNLIALKVAWNNYDICENELEKRGFFFDDDVHPS